MSINVSLITRRPGHPGRRGHNIVASPRRTDELGERLADRVHQPCSAFIDILSTFDRTRHVYSHTKSLSPRGLTPSSGVSRKIGNSVARRTAASTKRQIALPIRP